MSASILTDEGSRPGEDLTENGNAFWFQALGRHERDASPASLRREVVIVLESGILRVVVAVLVGGAAMAGSNGAAASPGNLGPCTAAERTLGLGDMLGLESLY
ncbi:hypothetical protein NSZ01_00220 [Nocardioides szechwanensis]|nr:hypothetical protein NSZ01_00220 [Nocardioides szechwanensis]